MKGTEVKKKRDLRYCVIPDLVLLRGERKFKEHPKNRILVPLGLFSGFSTSNSVPFIWYMGVPPGLIARTWGFDVLKTNFCHRSKASRQMNASSKNIKGHWIISKRQLSDR